MYERLRPGDVRDAIMGFLGNVGREASVGEIEEAVSARHGQPISGSSVRSYLQLNTPGVFSRTGPGVYALNSRATSAALHSPVREFFQFGRARYYLADCLEWLRTRAGHSIHAVVTDPPYGLVEYSHTEQSKLRRGKGGVWRIPPAFDGHQRSPLPRFTTLDKRQIDELRHFFRRWGTLLFPALVPGAHVLIASNPLVSYVVAHEMVGVGFERRGEIIRLVMTMRGGDRPKNAHKEFEDVTVMPRSMWEPWLLFRKPVQGRVQDNLRKWKTGGLRRPSKERPFGDVIKSSPTHKSERSIAPHPSLKPQAFLRQVARAILPLGEGVVLDPFAGAGSTLAACEFHGYESIGVERDPHYAAMAEKALLRLAQFGIPDQRLYTQD